jgi:membrane-associated phospholipid phosphatase
MARKRETQRPAVVGHSVAGVRADRVLVWVVGFYVAVLAAMVVFGRYVFIVKSLVVPVLLLAALLSGRFKRFVNDWAVFLGMVVFFDFCRGLALAATARFELPMYLGYVVTWDRWLCGGVTAPERLQHLRAALSDPVWLDRLFVLVYSSHYIFFLLFGFAIWQRRRAAFRAYTTAIIAVLYGGLVFYVLVPTIPPWAAANEFLVLTPMVQIVRTFYNVHLPQLVTAFDVNPIAAMPSLHAALPAICALLALRYFGRWGLVVLGYALAICVTVVYLGEHYLVDVIAGWLLALAVDAAVHWWGVASDAAPPPARDVEERWAVRPMVIALLLITVAVGFGQLAARWRATWPITREFVERELTGSSVLAHYYLGRLAFVDGDYAHAEVELTRALTELSDPVQQKVIRTLLGMSASRARDFPR